MDQKMMIDFCILSADLFSDVLGWLDTGVKRGAECHPVFIFLDIV